jgi:sodium transport system permease protein
MNLTLLARDLLVGRAMWPGVVTTQLATGILAALALAAAARVYISENLVSPARRSSGPPVITTSAGDAMTLFALAFLLLYFVFLPLEKRHLGTGLLAAEWLGLFGLTMVYARASGRRFGTVIALVPPSTRALAGALLVGSCAWPAVAILSEWLLPVPEHVLEELRKVLAPQDGSRSFAVTVVMMALSPAICEETLFRGPILRGLSNRMGPGWAIVTSAALFGAFHLDMYRLLPATLLGTLLGILAYRARSIVPSMLAHLCNNTILIALARSGLDRRMDSLGRPALAIIVVTSVALTGAGVSLVYTSSSKV